MPAARWALLLCAAGATARPAQGQALAYRPTQFACATYLERSRTDLRSETAGEIRAETVRRDGRWRMLGTPAPRGTAIEAWYDSLSLVRRIPDGDLIPDTDGVIGGRFRGLLAPDGRWQRQVAPFVPASIGEVADVAAALDNLLPRLPAFDLRPGGTWKDGTGLVVTRLSDSLTSGQVIVRLHYEEQRKEQAPLQVEEPVVGATQQVNIEGEVRFEEARGLLRHERSGEIQTFVHSGKLFPAAVRSRAVERFVLERVADGAGEDCR